MGIIFPIKGKTVPTQGKLVPITPLVCEARDTAKTRSALLIALEVFVAVCAIIGIGTSGALVDRLSSGDAAGAGGSSVGAGSLNIVTLVFSVFLLVVIAVVLGAQSQSYATQFGDSCGDATLS